MHDHNYIIIPFKIALFDIDFNGDLLVFMGRAYMLRINPNRGLVARMSQRTVFQRSPIRPDAATEVMSGSRIVMMKGRNTLSFRDKASLPLTNI